ncbi:MAG: fibronectin type III domain-containing protein [Bryobacterales bacterium]
MLCLAALLFFLLAALPLPATPPDLIGCFVNTGDRSARVLCSLSAAHDNYKFRVFFDYDNVSLDRATRPADAGSNTSTIRNLRIQSLPPDSDVYFSPVVTDTDGSTWTSPVTCPVTCTNCGPGDNALFGNNGSGNSGISCTSGQFPRFHTATLDVCADGPPCKPAAPSHSGVTSAPAINGDTRTVASGCTNLQALINDAAGDAAGGGTAEEIVIPPAEVCRPEKETTPRIRYDLPNACPGMVVIRSGADAKLLPPAGTGTDPSFIPYTGKISLNVNTLKDLRTEPLRYQANAGCYYWENISVTPPALDEITPLTYSITNINPSTDTFTVASTSGIANGDFVTANLAGTGIRGAYGPAIACNVTATTFKLQTSTSCGGSSLDLVGTYASGGTLRRWIALPIQSISNSTPAELTAPSHGIGNFPDMTITSGSGSTVTVSGTPGEYQINNNQPLYVQGTSNGACNGIWKPTVSGSNITLPGASCSGVTSGTVRRLSAFSVFGTSDDDLGGVEPKVWYFDVQDADHIRLLNSTAQGVVATPGWITWEPDLIGPGFSRIDDNTFRTDITYDRVIVHFPFPWRQTSGIDGSLHQRLQVLNSWLQGERWHRVDPTTGNPGGLPSVNTHTSLFLTRSIDVQVRNTVFLRTPFLFADTVGGVGNADMTIADNLLWNSDAVVHRSNGHYYRHTFCLEFKSCEACAIKGNHFKGCRTDFNASGSTINLQNVGTGASTIDTTIRDVEVAYNTVERSAGFLQLAQFNTQASFRRILPTERVYVHDNLIVKLDAETYCETDDCSQGSPLFQIWDSVEDLIITRNTFHVERSAKPHLMNCVNIRGQGVAITKNIFVATEGSNSSELGVRSLLPSSSTELPVPIETEGSAAFAECFVRGASPDPLSTFSDNVIIPGLESSRVGTYAVKADSTNTTDTVCVHELIGNSTLTTFADLQFVGSTANPCNESLNTRLNLAFENGTWKPKPAYAGYGADIDVLRDEQSQNQTAMVTATTNQATISWTAPDTDACKVDLTHTTLDFSSAANITRQSYSGSPSKSQSVIFGGLTPGTDYAYRISCKRPVLRGLLTTGG